MLHLTTTRNGAPVHNQSFHDYDMAHYFFLVEAQRAFADPSYTVTLTSGINALKMVSNGTPYESDLFRSVMVTA